MKTPLTLVHLAGVALVVLCLVLCETLLASSPWGIKAALLAVATGVWGALGFKPIKALQEKIVQDMPPEEVVRIQSIKPPPPPAPTQAPAPPHEPGLQ